MTTTEFEDLVRTVTLAVRARFRDMRLTPESADAVYVACLVMGELERRDLLAPGVYVRAGIFSRTLVLAEGYLTGNSC